MDLLKPDGEFDARTVVAGLGLREDNAARPRVVAAMIASADGRATIEGRSGGLGHPADRDLFRELRAGADAILVGTNTITVERYADLLDEEPRAWRTAAGEPREPLLATVDRFSRLRSDDVPIFADPGARVRVYREAPDPPFDGARAAVDVVALGEGGVTFAAILADLHAAGVRGVTCEGGPRLLHEMLAQGCVDDLMLTIAPLAVGGAGPTVLTGDAFNVPHRLELRSVLRADDHLFLHYSVTGQGR